jgi:hypothetical protein
MLIHTGVITLRPPAPKGANRDILIAMSLFVDDSIAR